MVKNFFPVIFTIVYLVLTQVGMKNCKGFFMLDCYSQGKSLYCLVRKVANQMMEFFLALIYLPSDIVSVSISNSQLIYYGDKAFQCMIFQQIYYTSWLLNELQQFCSYSNDLL